MLSAIGIGVGGVIAFAASGLLRTLLYEVSTRDPLVRILDRSRGDRDRRLADSRRACLAHRLNHSIFPMRNTDP